MNKRQQERVDIFIKMREQNCSFDEIATRLAVSLNHVYKVISYQAAQQLNVPRDNLLFRPHSPHIAFEKMGSIQLENPGSKNGKLISGVSKDIPKREYTPEEEIMLCEDIIEREKHDNTARELENTLLRTKISKKQDEIEKLQAQILQIQTECNDIQTKIDKNEEYIEDSKKYIVKKLAKIERLKKELAIHVTTEIENSKYIFIKISSVDEDIRVKMLSTIIMRTDVVRFYLSFYQAIDKLQIDAVKEVAAIIAMNDKMKEQNGGKSIVWHFLKESAVTNVLRLTDIQVQIDQIDDEESFKTASLI